MTIRLNRLKQEVYRTCDLGRMVFVAELADRRLRFNLLVRFAN